MKKQKQTAVRQSKRVTTDKRGPRDPMQDPTPTAAKRASKVKKAKRSASSTDRAQCTAHKKNGDPCSNPPVRGATVCRMHGGSAPQVRAKANQRLIEMVLPAMRELNKILHSPHTTDADKLKAINMVLNRTGYNDRQMIDIGFREPSPWDLIGQNAVITVDRNSIGPAEHPDALGGGGVDEGSLDAALDARERAREREASTRLDNHGHEVVPGETQRHAADLFDVAGREVKDWKRGPRAEMEGERLTEDDRTYEDRLRDRVEESERRTGRKR